MFAFAMLFQEDHEFASIQSSDDPTLQLLLNFQVTVPDGGKEALLDRYEDEGYPEVLIVSFMADWCKNSVYQAPLLQETYERWGESGVQMAIVAEYSLAADFTEFVKEHELSVPYYFGEVQGKLEDQRETTTHYLVRTLLGDDRGWGTPLHILILKGDRKTVYYVPGEFVEEELESFLNDHLKNKHPEKD